LPKNPIEILEAGEFDNTTEILLGTNKDEGKTHSSFVRPTLLPYNLFKFVQVL